jgi:hypothetical protein
MAQRRVLDFYEQGHGDFRTFISQAQAGEFGFGDGPEDSEPGNWGCRSIKARSTSRSVALSIGVSSHSQTGLSTGLDDKQWQAYNAVQHPAMETSWGWLRRKQALHYARQTNGRPERNPALQSIITTLMIVQYNCLEHASVKNRCHSDCERVIVFGLPK